MRSRACWRGFGSASRAACSGQWSSGVAAGLLVNGWLGAGGGVVGGVIGSVSAATIVRGAGRRGATRAARPVILLGVALAVGLLALVPLVGYLEAIVLPVLAARQVRRTPEKYAGLRSLAK